MPRPARKVAMPPPLPSVPPADKPLPRLPLLILGAVYQLMNEASGTKIIECIRGPLISKIEAPQIYITLKKLVEVDGLLERSDPLPSYRAPPRKNYLLTEAGTLELAASIAYYDQIVKAIRNT